MPGGHVLAVAAEERGIVDGKQHAHRRLVHGDGRQSLRILEIGHRIAYLEVLQADYSADIPALHLPGALLLESLEYHQVLDLLFLHRAVLLAEGDLHAGRQGSAADPAHRDTSHVGRIFEGGNQHLGSALHILGRRYLSHDSVQQRDDVTRGLAPVQGHPALLGTAVDSLEVQLLLSGVEREHQVEDLLVDLVGTAVGLVHLVDHHDRLLAHLYGLLQHESGLRHGALEGIHQQQHSVRHVEHPLDLASEIGVARSVYNIDLDALVGHRYVLGEDSDTSLTLQIVVVQNQVAPVLSVLPDELRLIYHSVHQSGLTVVDMGDDGYISYVLHIRGAKLIEIYLHLHPDIKF